MSQIRFLKINVVRDESLLELSIDYQASRVCSYINLSLVKQINELPLTVNFDYSYVDHRGDKNGYNHDATIHEAVFTNGDTVTFITHQDFMYE